MAKVNYENPKTLNTFNELSVGNFFIFCNKLYLKVNDYEAWNAYDYEKDNIVSFTKSTVVFFKDANDIEITVK